MSLIMMCMNVEIMYSRNMAKVTSGFIPFLVISTVSLTRNLLSNAII